MREKKPHLLIYSQCHIYGGSERLMQSIYKNEKLNSLYTITFSYLYFNDYKKGLERDNTSYTKPLKLHALLLLSNGNVFHKINSFIGGGFLRKLIKLPFFLIQKSGFYGLWNYPFFFVYLLLKKPNIVHINNGGYPAAETCNQLARVLILFPKIRVIYQANNKAVLSKTWYAKVFDSFINKGVDMFLTHSRQNMESLIARGFNSKKVTSFVSQFSESIAALGDAGKYANKLKFTLCMVGFLSYRKGQMFVLQALVSLRESHPDIYAHIELNLVGDGDENANLLAYAKANNLLSLVNFLGNRSDYIGYIKQCDVFLLTSIESEDLPLVLISAMESAKCIVASQFAGIADLLHHNFDSLLIAPNKETLVQDITKSIVWLYENPMDKCKFERNVLSTFNKAFSKERYAENLISLYTQHK